MPSFRRSRGLGDRTINNDSYTDIILYSTLNLMPVHSLLLKKNQQRPTAAIKEDM